MFDEYPELSLIETCVLKMEKIGSTEFTEWVVLHTPDHLWVFEEDTEAL